jgi:hypothetical protein
MHTFFSGWRRKVGCVTLVMACVLTGLRTRSSFAVDHIAFTLGRKTHLAGSMPGRMIWESSEDVPRSILNWGTTDAYGYGYFSPMSQYAPPGKSPFTSRLTELRYEGLILPLTLLSAYLILRKPRKMVGAQPG